MKYLRQNWRIFRFGRAYVSAMNNVIHFPQGGSCPLPRVSDELRYFAARLETVNTPYPLWQKAMAAEIRRIALELDFEGDG